MAHIHYSVWNMPCWILTLYCGKTSWGHQGFEFSEDVSHYDNTYDHNYEQNLTKGKKDVLLFDSYIDGRLQFLQDCRRNLFSQNLTLGKIGRFE